jgi:formate dehydrogenase major subunit
MLEHFHWGNITYRTQGIVEKVPRVFIEVSPELAKERELKDGDLVRVTSRVGSIKARVLVTNRVTGKYCFLAIHDNQETTVNTLTMDKRDPSTKTPAYKELPVKIERLERGTESPLPRSNPRHHRRIPQVGVRVEEKWRRPEYSPIGEGDV